MTKIIKQIKTIVLFILILNVNNLISYDYSIEDENYIDDLRKINTYSLGCSVIINIQDKEHSARYVLPINRILVIARNERIINNDEWDNKFHIFLKKLLINNDTLKLNTTLISDNTKLFQLNDMYLNEVYENTKNGMNEFLDKYFDTYEYEDEIRKKGKLKNSYSNIANEKYGFESALSAQLIKWRYFVFWDSEGCLNFVKNRYTNIDN
jgi:hypothetical protein